MVADTGFNLRPHIGTLAVAAQPHIGIDDVDVGANGGILRRLPDPLHMGTEVFVIRHLDGNILNACNFHYLSPDRRF